MAGGNPRLRTYLVVIDDSDEARVALRFAARRAAKTKGSVEVLAVVAPQDFVQWGGVQAAFEQEQKLRIEGIVSGAVGEIFDEAGIKPAIVLRQGEPVKTVREYLTDRDDIAALVLGDGWVFLLPMVFTGLWLTAAQCFRMAERAELHLR